MSSGLFEIAQIQSSEKSQPHDFRFVSRMNVWRWTDRIFLMCCFSAILFVAAADTWFAVVNERILLEEKNPVCEWLIRLAPESCSFFIAGKICGTLLVVATLYTLLRVRYRFARLVIAVVALFQLGLITYLCLADPLLNGWINFDVLFDESIFRIFYVFTFK